MAKKVLVIGATGTQGIPAVRALVDKGFEVHGMSRLGSAKAARLAELGAEVVSGDLFDATSLEAAMEGMDGVVFIPPVPTSGDPIPELTVGLNVVRAAEASGVRHIVHTSVDRAGDHEGFRGWGEGFGYNYRMYWLAKSWVVDVVKASSVPVKTILKPALIMEDFVPPMAASSFPMLKDGVIATAIAPDTKVHLVAVEDQGALTAEALSDPERFDGAEIPLAGDVLTMAEAADVIARVTGKEVRAESLTPDEFMTNPDVVAAFDEVFGDFAPDALAGCAQGHEWDNADGYTATPADAQDYGVRLSTFAEWAGRHASDFDIR